MANNVMERTASKTLVSGRHGRMVPAGMIWTHHQAVVHHGRSIYPMKFMITTVLAAVAFFGCSEAPKAKANAHRLPLYVAYEPGRFFGPVGTDYAISESATMNGKETRVAVWCRRLDGSSATLIFEVLDHGGRISATETNTVDLSAPQAVRIFNSIDVEFRNKI